MAIPAAVPSEDTYAFDTLNAVKVWLHEKVARSEIAARDADQAVRNLDGGKTATWTEDKIKLALGPIKDTIGSAKLGEKLAKDFGNWYRCRVYFKSGASGDLVIIKGWPNGRRLLSATRYRVDNPKIMELQIGKPGIMAAAKDSARFGVILVVAIDVVEFARTGNLAQLLGSLTIDVPSVALASAVGAFAGSVATDMTVGLLAVGSFALGPALIALAVGVVVGAALWALDNHFHITEKVTAAYERGLERLKRWWEEAGQDAERRWSGFVNSQAVRHLERSVGGFFQSIGNALSADDNAGLRSLI